ncbi:MAG: nitroreductase family protein [Christensenellaceae bacterium]|jgi:nitroreductase|nr:nitroreductase family protein [Christensenellaceae bacterium]
MIIEAIKKRKSIRNYNPNGKVSDEQIKELLEAAMLAPSACNTRPWEFIVVKDRKILDKIVDFHNWAKMLKTAQAAIVVIALPDVQIGKSGEGMWQHDCGATTQNILLQAAELNLGTCWCGLHPVEKYMNDTRELFKLQNNAVPFCVIAVGVPAEGFGSRGFFEESKVKWIK